MKKEDRGFHGPFVLSTVYSRACFLLCLHLILSKAKGVFSKAVAKGKEKQPCIALMHGFMLLAVLFKGRRTLCVASVTLSYKRFILTAVDYCDLAENFSAFVAEYQRFACF